MRRSGAASALFQLPVIVQFVRFGEFGVEDVHQIRQHAVGTQYARFPEIAAARRVAAAVVVVDAPLAHGRRVGQPGILPAHFVEGVAAAHVEPEIGFAREVVGLLDVDRQRLRGRVLLEDVPCAGIFEEPHHVAVARRHEPGVAVGGVEHHARPCGGLLGEGTQPFVAFGNGGEEAGTLRAESCDLGGDDHPFALAQRRLLAWTPSINYGEPVNDADASYGKQLVYVPEYAAAATATLGWRRWTLVYKWNYYSERYTTTSNDTSLRTGRLEPYYMSDLSLERSFALRWADLSLKGVVRNLFNVEYVTVLSRPMPRLNYEIFLDIRPKFHTRKR